MEKNTHLINVYLKIYHKKPLTMEDLRYLAEYDPECFEKTCKNVVYNIPEAKSIMEPEVSEAIKEGWKPDAFNSEKAAESHEWQNIGKVLENLKSLEVNGYPMGDIDTDQVKNLLGSLYMEMLFPHDDKYAFVTMTEEDNKPLFDKKA